MFNLATAQISQGVSDNSVVQIQHGHGRLIAQCLGQRRGLDDVRKENGSDSRISFIGATARDNDCPRCICFGGAEKSLCQLRLNLNNLLGDHAMGFTVDAISCLRVRCIDQAEDLPFTLVHPIFEVLDAVLFLRLEIGRMSFRDIFRSRPVNLVNVHV